MVGSLDPPPGVEDLAEFSLGVGGLALGGDHPGDLVPGGQDVGVVGSHDPRVASERTELRAAHDDDAAPEGGG